MDDIIRSLKLETSDEDELETSDNGDEDELETKLKDIVGFIDSIDRDYETKYHSALEIDLRNIVRMYLESSPRDNDAEDESDDNEPYTNVDDSDSEDRRD